MTNNEGSKRALREAAEWHARLNARDVDQDDLEAFFVWRRIPEHARAYGEIDKLWSSSETLGDRRGLAEAVHEALARPGWRRRFMHIEQHVHRPTLAAVLAIILVACAGLMITLVRTQAGNAYQTAKGELRTIPLDDGSVVQLDSATRLRVRLTARTRRVDLVAGRALFSVAHDPHRPFIVHVGNADIEAIGTRFDVDALTQGEPEVVLVQGRVALGRDQGDARSFLEAGYAAHFDAAGWATPYKVDTDTATSWTSGRLRFRATPLASAVAQMNRYADHPLILASSAHDRLLVSGSFDARDTRGFADALQALYGLQSIQQDDGSTQLH